MARSYPENLGPGAYVNTTEVLDPTEIERLEIPSEEFFRFLNVLSNVVNEINLALNLKDTGYYTLEEFVNSQLFFPDPA